MLNVYYGNDMVAARKAALSAIDISSAKTEARLNKLETSNFAPGMLADMLGSVSLFGGAELFLIDTLRWSGCCLKCRNQVISL
jgi:hypothetical protein